MDKQRIKISDILFYVLAILADCIFLSIHIYRILSGDIRSNIYAECIGIIAVSINIIRMDLKSNSTHKKIPTFFAVVVICIAVLFDLFILISNN